MIGLTHRRIFSLLRSFAPALYRYIQLGRKPRSRLELHPMRTSYMKYILPHFVSFSASRLRNGKAVSGLTRTPDTASITFLLCDYFTNYLCNDSDTEILFWQEQSGRKRLPQIDRNTKIVYANLQNTTTIHVQVPWRREKILLLEIFPYFFDLIIRETHDTFSFLVFGDQRFSVNFSFLCTEIKSHETNDCTQTQKIQNNLDAILRQKTRKHTGVPPRF